MDIPHLDGVLVCSLGNFYLWGFKSPQYILGTPCSYHLNSSSIQKIYLLSTCHGPGTVLASWQTKQRWLPCLDFTRGNEVINRAHYRQMKYVYGMLEDEKCYKQTKKKKKK